MHITDERTLNGLYMWLADELTDPDWTVTLTALSDLFTDISVKASKKISKFIDCQLLNWFASLSKCIKHYLPNLNYESWVYNL